MNISKNISLIVGLTIPVLMVIAVATSIYIPRLGQHPQTNFVYAVGAYPVYEEDTAQGITVHTYEVKNEKWQETIVTKPFSADSVYRTPSYETAPKFWLYDVKQKTNTELSVDQLKALGLDTNAKSTDGYSLERGGYNDFPFGGSDIPGWFLVGHNVSYKLSLQESSNINRYDSSVAFIGWVK